MEDRRTIKTKRAIREAFLSLLKSNNINRITVAEISRKADLGRGTFYLHYKDVYDLYDYIENELYGELIKIFDASFPSSNPDNLMSLIETITSFIENNRDIFLLLIRPERDGEPLRKLKTIFKDMVLLEDAEQHKSEYYEIESMFIVSGVIGVLEEWLNNGLILPQKRISALLHQVVVRF